MQFLVMVPVKWRIPKPFSYLSEIYQFNSARNPGNRSIPSGIVSKNRRNPKEMERGLLVREDLVLGSVVPSTSAFPGVDFHHILASAKQKKCDMFMLILYVFRSKRRSALSSLSTTSTRGSSPWTANFVFHCAALRYKHRSKITVHQV